jgi:hypothetical protein
VGRWGPHARRHRPGVAGDALRFVPVPAGMGSGGTGDADLAHEGQHPGTAPCHTWPARMLSCPCTGGWAHPQSSVRVAGWRLGPSQKVRGPCRGRG